MSVHEMFEFQLTVINDEDEEVDFWKCIECGSLILVVPEDLELHHNFHLAADPYFTPYK